MPLIQNPLNFNCLSATGLKAATQSRKGLQDRQMNRSGRRTIFAMLLIVALVIIWTVMGGRSLARA
jgi:hypothetical protein